jgi:hypothetical protein
MMKVFFVWNGFYSDFIDHNILPNKQIRFLPRLTSAHFEPKLAP